MEPVLFAVQDSAESSMLDDGCPVVQLPRRSFFFSPPELSDGSGCNNTTAAYGVYVNP